MKRKRLTTTGENILILASIIDILIICNNKITSINILLYILYLIKIVIFIKYNKTFKK